MRIKWSYVLKKLSYVLNFKREIIKNVDTISPNEHHY